MMNMGYGYRKIYYQGQGGMPLSLVVTICCDRQNALTVYALMDNSGRERA